MSLWDPPDLPPARFPAPLPPFDEQEYIDYALLALARHAPDTLRETGWTTEDVNAAERRQAARENREPREWTL